MLKFYAASGPGRDGTPAKLRKQGFLSPRRAECCISDSCCSSQLCRQLSSAAHTALTLQESSSPLSLVKSSGGFHSPNIGFRAWPLVVCSILSSPSSIAAKASVGTWLSPLACLLAAFQSYTSAAAVMAVAAPQSAIPAAVSSSACFTKNKQGRHLQISVLLGLILQPYGRQYRRVFPADSLNESSTLYAQRSGIATTKTNLPCKGRFLFALVLITLLSFLAPSTAVSAGSPEEERPLWPGRVARVIKCSPRLVTAENSVDC